MCDTPSNHADHGWVLLSEMQAVMQNTFPKVFCGFFFFPSETSGMLLSYANLTLKLYVVTILIPDFFDYSLF